MLEFKDNPRELMQALDRFLSVYFGDCQVENQINLEEVAAWNIPQVLKDLYSFVGKYIGKRGFLITHDSLRINSSKGKRYAGKILIVSEREGCWGCYTDTKGEDPPVWTMDYGWKEDSPKWKLVNNSLSQFLVTFCLAEAYTASRYHRCIKHFSSSVEPDKMLAAVDKLGFDAYLLWQGDYPTNLIYKDEHDFHCPNRFYSIEDAILVWWSCATNYKNADSFLTSIQSDG